MKTYSRRTALTICTSLFAVGLTKKSFGFAHGKLLGGGAGVGGVISGVAGSLISDPLFDKKTIGQVYVVSSRLIHLTTINVGKGIVSAVKALEIKNEKDIPAYLNELDTVEMPNSFTGQVQERDAEIMEFSTKASEDIKEKLKSGFSLSKEAKSELAKAYTFVGLSEIHQGKSQKGMLNFGLKLKDQTDMLSFAIKLKDALKLDLDPEEFLKALTGFVTDVGDLFSNMGGIVEVKDAISSAKDMKGVELAKAEFLEESASKTTDDSVVTNLEQFAV